MQLKDIFQLDFNEEIEAVIKVGKYTDKIATEEIKNYIVTDQIAENIADFIDYYDKRAKETGIWISGFYGSGKSYLAKMIGYLLENPELMGVHARELFRDRLVGLDNGDLLENKIAGLGRYKTKTVVFDVSGENLQGSFYKKLLLNFIKSMGLPKNYLGYTEYQIMKTNQYEEFLKIANRISQERIDDDWKVARTNKMYGPAIMKEAWMELESEDKTDTEQNLDRMNDTINTIDADGLVGELDDFLKMKDDYDRIVFIVDEVSEALDKDHIDLSELRGTAQHLSADKQGKYWFIATAQEKLENILSQKNVTQNDINIITDRFQLKVHLSSAQVDKVIKERILAKNKEGKARLKEFFQDNDGAINTLSSLQGKFNTSIDSVNEFIDYYPFFNYQMRLLKKFLYSVFQQAQAGGSERGMLVTVDKILKNEEFHKKEIGEFATAYQLCEYGFPMHQSELENKFDDAAQDLEGEDQEIDGKDLMRTVFFLEKSEDLKRTVDNITKAYHNDLSYIGDIKPDIEESLDLLEDKSYILEENHQYKITSDIEETMMEEMNTVDADWEHRIALVRDVVKDLQFITRYASNKLDGKTYNIAIKDEKGNLLSHKKAEVSLIIYNVLNVDDDIETELEDMKDKYVDVDRAALIPEIKSKDQIDKLARKIYKYQQIVSRYRNTTDPDRKQVVDSFQSIINNDQNTLETLIEQSYYNSWLIYDFNETKLDRNNINTKIDEVETTMIDRSFSKRLKSNLSEDVARKFLKVHNKKLHNYCTDSQFAFFDEEGNFIGEDLKVVDEINEECKAKSGRNGSGLLDKFQHKPYGWSYEAIAGTMAALIRAGRLKIKHAGNTYRDYKKEQVKKVFTSIHRFKKASFYTIIEEGLESSLKQKIVDKLKDIDTENKVKHNYNQNDFQVVSSIKEVALQYRNQFQKLKQKVEREILNGNQNIKTLNNFSGMDINERNLKETGREFLNNSEAFEKEVKYITKLQHFIDHNYKKYEEITRFLQDVNNQLQDTEDSKLKQEINKLYEDYQSIKEKGVVANFDRLKSRYNKIRQKFNELFESYFTEYQKAAHKLLNAARRKKKEIEDLSVENNRGLYKDINNYIKNCQKIDKADFQLSKSEAKEINSNSSLKEVITGTELFKRRAKDVVNQIPDGPKPETQKKKTYQLNLPKETNNLAGLKRKLQQVLEAIDDDEYDNIQITIK